MKFSKAGFKGLFFCSMLFALSGCWPFSDKKNETDNGSSGSSLDENVLIKVDGNVVLTVEEYESMLKTIVASNEQVAIIIDNMPNAEKEYIFNNIVINKLMKAWLTKNGFDKSEEFIQEQKQAYESIDAQLAWKYYDKTHLVNVSDKEVQEFYSENKASMPTLVISPGGVLSHFARFENKEDAEAFYAVVKTVSKEKFKKEAEARYVKIQEAVINPSSQHSQSVKEFAKRVKKTPHVEIVKVSDNSYWVVQALEKEEAEYRPLNSVKESLIDMIAKNKKEQALDQNMAELKKEMNVLENHDYFAKKAEQRQKDREDMMNSQSFKEKMLQVDMDLDEEDNNNILKV